MNRKYKLMAIMWKLWLIPQQERKIYEIDMDEVLSRTSDEMLDFFYDKLVKER